MKALLSVIVLLVIGVIVVVMIAFAGAPSVPAAPPPVSGVTDILIQARPSQFEFDSSQYTFKAGQRYRVIFINGGYAEHEMGFRETAAPGTTGAMVMGFARDIVLDMSQARLSEDEQHEMHEMAEIGMLHLHAAPGGLMTAEFTPVKAGTFDGVCTRYGHDTDGVDGMRAAILVEGD